MGVWSYHFPALYLSWLGSAGAAELGIVLALRDGLWEASAWLKLLWKGIC